MRESVKRYLFRVFGLLSIIVISGCASTASAPPVPAASKGPSGALNVALVSLGSENWIPRMNNPDEAPIWELIMDSPIGVSPKDGFSLDPNTGLIEKWELKTSGENIDLTLKFRKGIPFHKGEGTVKASDFKFTFAEFMRDGSVNPSAGEKKKIVNGDINNIEIVDELTAVIHTKTAWVRAGLEGELSFTNGGFYGVMPEAYFKRVGGEEGYRKAPVGTGPFQFVEHRANEYFRVEAVENHWRKTPAYKTVTLSKVPDSTTALAQLKSGQVDMVGLTPRQLAEIQNNKDLRVVRIANSGEIFVVFGGMVQPTRPGYDPNLPWISGDLLSDKAKKVREAMTISVDQKAIVGKLLAGEARPVALPYLFDQPNAGWYNPNWKAREYNPTRAKQLLADAGYPNGFSLKAFIYPLPYNPANGDVMEAVAGYWEAIGIKVERQQVEYRPTVRTRLAERTTAGFVYAYTQPSYYDPYRYLGGSCCFRTDAVLNHWEITFVDQKTDVARTTYDEKQRDAVMRTVGDFIYDNFIGLPMAATSNLWAVRNDKVGKWEPLPGSSWLRNLDLVEKP